MDFEKIYREYFRDVFLYVRSLAAEDHLAEEIAQETFVKALKAIDTYHGEKDIRAWLFTIAKNTFYTHCRRQKRYAGYELPENCQEGPSQIEERLADEDTAFSIHKFLHQMEEPYKEVPELFIPYDEEKFQIVEESGKLYAEYLGDCHDGTEAIAPIEVNVNGEKQTIVCFSYYDSPWSRYLEPKIVSEKNRAETHKRCFLGETGKIDQVYYGEFDIEDMAIKEQPFHEQLSSLLDDMELIYETD